MIAPEPQEPAASSSLQTPRARRRHQTREEILDAALAVVSEQGAAALNMSEVARRVGLRQASLYQYFDSRSAMYDGLFERGMRAHLDVVEAAVRTSGPGLVALRAIAAGTVTFTVTHVALSTLIFTPAVPGFEPSPAAYAPSLRVQELVTAAAAAAAERGELRAEAAAPQGIALYVSLVAGIGVQQLANHQHAPDDGTYLPLLAEALDMWEAWYAA